MPIPAMTHYINGLDIQSSGHNRDFFFQKSAYCEIHITYVKEVPNFEIVWFAPVTLRALNIKAVYEVSHRWNVQIIVPVFM